MRFDVKKHFEKGYQKVFFGETYFCKMVVFRVGQYNKPPINLLRINLFLPPYNE